MKTLLALLIVFLLPLIGTSQTTTWDLTGNTLVGTEKFGSTSNSDVRFFSNNAQNMTLKNTGELGLGITSPSSWLHIKSNASGTVNAKEVFRTEVPSATESDWRMYVGTNQMFRLWNPVSANAIFINALRGDLKFVTGNTSSGSFNSMIINGGTGSDASWIGMGDFSAFSPQTNLHIHTNASASAGIQLSNSTTGASTIGGIRMLMDLNGKFSLYDYQDQNIVFGTANTVSSGGALADRMTISGGTNYGRVGVATNSPGAQLDVFDNIDLPIGGDDISFRAQEILAQSNTVNRAIGAEIHAEEGTQSIGVEVTVDNVGTSNHSKIMYGVYSAARNTDASNYVTDAYCYDAFLNYTTNLALRKYGYHALVGNASPTNTLETYGALMYAVSGTGTNYGGRFEASSTSTSPSYGVYGKAVGNGAKYGVYGDAVQQTCTTSGGVTTCAGAAGYFVGDVFASGNVYGTSDAMLKDQITPVTTASSLLSPMQCKQFVFKNQNFPELNLPTGSHYGFIAQDVEAVLPNLVKEFFHPATYDTLGTIITPATNVKAVNYQEFIPLLVAAFNEQKQVIDSLLNALSVATPGAGNRSLNTNSSSQKVTLSDSHGIILNQNDPNPFMESTTIRYTIPVEIKDAKLLFSDNKGMIFKTVEIESRGIGSLDVYASELSTGIYTYSLVCDGKVIESKKMMKN